MDLTYQTTSGCPTSCARPTATGGTSTGARRCRSSASRPACASRRIRRKLRTSATFEEVSPAAYDPAAYLAANEEDGVWGAVIYPSEGLVIFSVPNTEVVTASMAVYNDWIAEFCVHDTGRLKGIGMVNVDDPADATAELRRCHSLGLAGALITVAPPAWLPYRSREFDEFWATAAELRMPLSLHVGTDRGDPRAERVRAQRQERAAVGLRQQGLPGPAHPRRLHVLRRLRAPPGIADRHGRARARLDPVLPAAAGLHLHRQADRAARSGRVFPIPMRCRRSSSAPTASPASRRTRSGCGCAT